MRTIQGTLTTLSVFGILCQSAITEANGVIRNGTVWHDTNGDEIWCNGGHMIREDGVPKLKWYDSWKIDEVK
jgi:hypothetical protein